MYTCGAKTLYGEPCEHPVSGRGQVCWQHHAQVGSGAASKKRRPTDGCSFELLPDKMGIRCLTHNDDSWEVAYALGAPVPCKWHIRHWAEATMLGRIKHNAPRGVGSTMPVGMQALQKQSPLWMTAHMSEGRPGNLTLPPAKLLLPIVEQLAKSDKAGTRSAVARHHTTPPAILQQMAADVSWFVRAQVAANRNTPAPALQQLAGDTWSQVLIAVVKNPSCPESVQNRAIDHLWATHAHSIDYLCGTRVKLRSTIMARQP